MSPARATGRTAPANRFPCELHRFHWPRPLVVQFHHRFPKYLQAKALGVPLEGVEKHPLFNPTTIAICGTSHDTVHRLIDFMLAGDKPKHSGRELELAKYAVALYRNQVPTR